MTTSILKGAALVAIVAALASCGGGGGGSDAAVPYSLQWEQSSYTIVSSPTGTTTLGASANVIAQGSNLPPVMGVSISPSGSGTNPTVGNGGWFVNSLGRVPVQFSVSPTAGAGTYPKGSYPFTASMTINGQTYSSTTTLVVQ